MNNLKLLRNKIYNVPVEFDLVDECESLPEAPEEK